ncbi:E3 ubiquitin-protein ligase NHLRC1 [Fundulus heteroclitus]|uniref:E3 ubiquitin-protein ligase NHLRC1 n=1 Tax=Fundulus heteroclitus TaxID=8078 RepID=UPI00165C2859|nr:E3 ubiquitin-protein ligase NHLRC1 [Fundulus heteroclitus]
MDQSPGCLSPEATLREIQINLLECKVCFETFTSQQRERRPQNLSCGHVLCLECIAGLSHPLLRKLECPFCRQLCSVDNISHCQVLSDLQDLLLSQKPSSSAPPCRAKGGLISETALHLLAAFGGWGTLTNPTGVAVLGPTEGVVVVHDGQKRVAVFNQQGRKLHSFGERGAGNGDICYPVDVAVSPTGFIVVTDAGDKAVKVFTSRGTHVVTVKGCFQLPWGVDTDSGGHILVSDVQGGALFRIKVDFGHGVITENQAVRTNLQSPKAVAHCRKTGNTAVVEHPKHQTRTLKVFTKDFHLLYQVDAFSLSLQSSFRLTVSDVAFSSDGDVVVSDADQGLICSLGNPQNHPVLTPLVGDHLIRPAGLVLLNNTIITVDGGDHTVKIYSTKPDA